MQLELQNALILRANHQEKVDEIAQTAAIETLLGKVLKRGDPSVILQEVEPDPEAARAFEERLREERSTVTELRPPPSKS